MSCLLCPACAAAWKPALTWLGVSFLADERQHGWLLIGSVALAVTMAVLDARKLKRWLPLALTALGAVAMVLGHQVERDAVELVGSSLFLAAVPVRLLTRPRR